MIFDFSVDLSLYHFIFFLLQGGNLPLPGVLAGWRPDLQGKMRPDSLQLDRDVMVQTTYGQVQGFKTYLYDDPNPLSGYRPGQTPVERIMGVVHTFLGIPYAQPPVHDARFKVSSNVWPRPNPAPQPQPPI